MEYNKRAILKVVNDGKLYSRYFCILVLILFLVICSKQFNKEACLVAGVNSKDFKEEDNISAKYKGAVFKLNKLTN